MSAASLGIEAQIEKQMMQLGSGVITDLDRFIMPDLNKCDMDGYDVSSLVDD